jgi:prevent-host-death family protein
MKSFSVNQAKDNLFQLVDQTVETSEPVLITGTKNNAVLVSEADWRAIQETLYLSQVKGLKESLIEGKNTPVEKCIPLEELEW